MENVLVQDDQQTHIMSTAIYCIKFEARMTTLFIIKANIHVFVKWSWRSPQKKKLN